MDEYNKVNAKLTDTQLKRSKNCCQKENRNNFKNEFKNVWHK